MKNSIFSATLVITYIVSCKLKYLIKNTLCLARLKWSRYVIRLRHWYCKDIISIPLIINIVICINIICPHNKKVIVIKVKGFLLTLTYKCDLVYFVFQKNLGCRHLEW